MQPPPARSCVDLLCLPRTNDHRIGLHSEQIPKSHCGTSPTTGTWRNFWRSPYFLHVHCPTFADIWAYCHNGVRELWRGQDRKVIIYIFFAVPPSCGHPLSSRSPPCLSEFVNPNESEYIRLLAIFNIPPLSDLPYHDTLQNALSGWCLFILQTALVVLPPDLVLVTILDRFNLLGYFSGSYLRSQYEGTHLGSMVEELFYVLITILSENANACKTCPPPGRSIGMLLRNKIADCAGSNCIKL